MCLACVRFFSWPSGQYYTLKKEKGFEILTSGFRGLHFCGGTVRRYYPSFYRRGSRRCCYIIIGGVIMIDFPIILGVLEECSNILLKNTIYFFAKRSTYHYYTYIPIITLTIGKWYHSVQGGVAHFHLVRLSWYVWLSLSLSAQVLLRPFLFLCFLCVCVCCVCVCVCV